MMYLMCGIPGSGKSTHARLMARQFNATIICPDDFQKEMTGKDFYGPIQDLLWATVKMTTRVLIKSGQRVIVDATALSKHRRSEWIRLARECDNAIHVYAHVTALDVCKENNQNRDRTVPEEVLRRQVGSYIVPSVHEGFNAVNLWDIVNGNFTLVGSAVQQPDAVHSDGRYYELAGERCYDSY